MAIGGMQRQAVDVPELLDLFRCLRRECGLAFKSMQNNPLEQVAQAHILKRRDGLQHLEQALFYADAGLNSFTSRCSFVSDICTNVPRYVDIRSLCHTLREEGVQYA